MKFKWNELSTVEKIESIVSLIMAILALVFGILDLSEKWPNDLCYLTLAVFSLFEGIVNWNKNRKIAILEFIAAASLAIAALF